MADFPTAKARRLKLDDPRVVRRYQNLLHQFLKDNKVYKKLTKLRTQWSPGQPLTKEEAKEFEDIDKLRTQGMKLAAKKCRKLKMGGRKWSPALKKARDTILYWTLTLRRMKGCKVGTRRLIRLQKKLKIKGSNIHSRAVVKTKLTDAYLHYKVCRANHEQLRLNHQESLAKAKAT